MTPTSAPSAAPAVSDQIAEAVTQNSVISATGLLERAFARLFEGLVYAQIWEDPVADIEAADIGEGARIFCIASGGCNVMSYLTVQPAAITAVDLSPAHIALLHLKLTAAQQVADHQAFSRFFAEANRSDNLELFDTTIAPMLDPTSRAWWNGRTLGRRRVSIFARGAYRFGVLGRFIGAAHLVARLTGVKLHPFLECRTQDEQRAWYRSNTEPLFDTRIVRFLASRRATLFGLGIPPAQHEKLAGDGGVVAVLRARTERLMCDYPLSDNYFAWQAFNRSYAPDGPRPPYLERENFETVRRMSDRVLPLNRSMTDALSEAAPASLDRYVLLDAQDWMTDTQLTALWAQITRTAAPGARVLFRTGGIDDILPGRVDPEILDQWRYDADSSARGLARDRSAIYGGVHVYHLKNGTTR
ncbi:DUF3419 family protein [Tropicimonas sp. S265A]|uniref:DUF3419 family protein n=1 Tax=Tropicimonas sp. S265A TaxID=3415134 RepID=UPI003C7E5FB0